MSIQAIITILDFLLWIIIAANVMYVLFFSLASFLPKKKNQTSDIKHPLDRRTLTTEETQEPSYLILFPAYREDSVILNSVKNFLQQDYPKELYQVIVISDQMQAETNEALSQLPITLLQPAFANSNKAKALQYAIEEAEKGMWKKGSIDFVVILDADNIVAPDFLTQLSQIANPEIAIQCHRTAKNANNDIAALDGLSEEINNSIFRKGHNRIGMSSALIGSGMCFNYDWFKNHVCMLDSAVEDRELEALLMKQGIYIHYAEDIKVMDEKVSNSDNFQRQRLRWMTGQVQAFFHMLSYIPKAIITGNINYIDKTIQQALIPRSILLVLTPLFALTFTILDYFSLLTSYFSLIKWYIILIAIVLAIFIAIPAPLRNKALLNKVLSLPLLVWKMIKNIFHIKPNNKEFIHTSHQQPYIDGE